MTHSKTPWIAYEDNTFLSIRSGKSRIAKMCAYEEEEKDANAKRIVACVNACDGIEDPGAEIKRLRNMERLMASADGYRILACLEAMDGVLDPVQGVKELNEEANRMMAHMGDLTAQLYDARKPKNKDWDEEQEECLKTFLADGLNINEIADEFCVHTDAIDAKLKPCLKCDGDGWGPTGGYGGGTCELCKGAGRVIKPALAETEK